MNGLRFVGQILLWLGFLSAALAACSQKEYDFLPDLEKVSLSKLVDGASISASELQQHSAATIEELSSEELETLCNVVAPILAKRADDAKRFGRLTNKPVADLTPEELDEYVSFVIPVLKEQSLARAVDEAKQKAGTFGENAEEPKKSAKSFGKKEFISKRTSLIENKWPTVNWLWYGLSMILGIGGVVLLRKTSKSKETESSRVAEEFSIVTRSLTDLQLRIGELAANLEKLAPQDVVEFIDETCVDPFTDFADARNALIQRYGLRAFAEIMTQFASGERFLNRTWSAAADGYMNEAMDSVTRSNAHIIRAGELLEKYESEHQAK